MSFDAEMLKKLVEIFQSELEESANVLVNGLVVIEKSDAHSEERIVSIETVFRTAHNLKGAARGLGINAIGDIAHEIESIFTDIKASNATVSKLTTDTCLEAVDKMHSAMHAFVNKCELDFDLDDLKKRLHACIDSSASAPKANEVVLDEATGITINLKKDRRRYQSKKVNDDKPIVQNQPVVSKNLNEHYSETSAMPIVNAPGDSIRVPLTVIDKLSELSEEIQSSKIEIEDNAFSAKKLDDAMQRLTSLWKSISIPLRHVSSVTENHQIQKLLSRMDDDVVEIANGISKLSFDISAEAGDYSRLSSAIQDEVSMLRLVPANNYLAMLPRYMRELSSELNKKVELEVHGGEVFIDKYILEGLKDPINHLLRNAIDHGIESPQKRAESGKSETGKITLKVKDAGNKVTFEISDDGAGLCYESIKNKIRQVNNNEASAVEALTHDQVEDYIFRSGFSTRSEISSISGRGVGLDVVRKNVQMLKGTINLKNEAGSGLTFIICVPLSLSSERGLIVRCDDQIFAIPTSSISRVKSVLQEDVINVQGSQAILVDGHPVLLKSLSEVLHINDHSYNDAFPCFIMSGAGSAVVFAVDQIIGEREMVIKPIQEPLANASCVAGATLLDRNKVAIVLDPDELRNITFSSLGHYAVSGRREEIQQVESKRILVVDDSITTRTLEKNILESQGFLVTTAVNGHEAWTILQNQRFSLIITDINMPLMDGFELTAKIKSSDILAQTPVIIVTSLGSDAEKARGVDVGADAYIVKNEFESGVLLQIISQLI